MLPKFYASCFLEALLYEMTIISYYLQLYKLKIVVKQPCINVNITIISEVIQFSFNSFKRMYNSNTSSLSLLMLPCLLSK